MLKRYAFELDAYEAGVIMGMLWHRPQTDPTRIHFETRLSEVVQQIYRDSGGGPGGDAVQNPIWRAER